MTSVILYLVRQAWNILQNLGNLGKSVCLSVSISHPGNTGNLNRLRPRFAVRVDLMCVVHGFGSQTCRSQLEAWGQEFKTCRAEHSTWMFSYRNKSQLMLNFENTDDMWLKFIFGQPVPRLQICSASRMHQGWRMHRVTFMSSPKHRLCNATGFMASWHHASWHGSASLQKFDNLFIA